MTPADGKCQGIDAQDSREFGDRQPTSTQRKVRNQYIRGGQIAIPDTEHVTGLLKIFMSVLFTAWVGGCFFLGAIRGLSILIAFQFGTA